MKTPLSENPTIEEATSYINTAASLRLLDTSWPSLSILSIQVDHCRYMSHLDFPQRPSRFRRNKYSTNVLKFLRTPDSSDDTDVTEIIYPHNRRPYMATPGSGASSIASSISLSSRRYSFPDKSSTPGTYNLNRHVHNQPLIQSPTRRLPFLGNVTTRSPRTDMPRSPLVGAMSNLPPTAEQTEPDQPNAISPVETIRPRSLDTAYQPSSNSPYLQPVRPRSDPFQDQELGRSHTFTTNSKTLRDPRHTQSRASLAAAAVMLPPLAVYLAVGPRKSMMVLSVVLTLCGWIPGVMHGVYVISTPGQWRPS